MILGGEAAFLDWLEREAMRRSKFFLLRDLKFDTLLYKPCYLSMLLRQECVPGSTASRPLTHKYIHSRQAVKELPAPNPLHLLRIWFHFNSYVSDNLPALLMQKSGYKYLDIAKLKLWIPSLKLLFLSTKIQNWLITQQLGIEPVPVRRIRFHVFHNFVCYEFLSFLPRPFLRPLIAL